MPIVQPDDLAPGDVLPTPHVNEPYPAEVVCPRGQCTHRRNPPPEKVHVKSGDAEWHIVVAPGVPVHVCDDDWSCADDVPGHRHANTRHAEVERNSRRLGMSLEAAATLDEEG